MNLLAIDTSTDYLSLAIAGNGKLLAEFHKKADRRHSILLVPMIDKLLKKAGLKIKEIGCFAISVGPGSFTGLRIGVTVVKGLAYSLKKKIVAVPTLDAIADNAKSFKGVICPVLDARKNKVYACLYKSDGKTVKKISKHLLLPLTELFERLSKYEKVVFLGDVIENRPVFAFGRQTKQCFGWHPKAEVVARLGAEYYRDKKFVKPEDLEPLYLYSRECDITGK